MTDEQTNPTDTSGGESVEEQKEDKDVSKPTSKIEEAREERKKTEEATQALKEENDRSEKLAAERALGGETEITPRVKKEPETALEYSQRLERGEADPFKDDGIE